MDGLLTRSYSNQPCEKVVQNQLLFRCCILFYLNNENIFLVATQSVLLSMSLQVKYKDNEKKTYCQVLRNMSYQQKACFQLSLLSFAFWALLTLVNGAEITESYPSVYFYVSYICSLYGISRVNRKIKNYISLIRQIHLRNQ